MRKLKTISEKELIEAAWFWYLKCWSEALERAESMEKSLGRKSQIAERRVCEYKKIEEELHDLCLELEHN